jgi:HK97 family phage major capsid protein
MDATAVKKFCSELQTREFNIDSRSVDKSKRTVQLSFSSESPVDRWFGKEILDHAAGSVRLKRLNDRASVLVNHEVGDQVGVVEKAWLDAGDRTARAVVRFGNSPRAEEIFQDIQDGIRSKTSFVYRVHAMELESKTEDEPTYRATDWEPFEISIVSVPADHTVGVGRALIFGEHTHMDKTESPLTVSLESKAGARQERERIVEMRAIQKRFNLPDDLVQKHIEDGTPLDEFKRTVTDTWKPKMMQTGSPITGLSEAEAGEFSICRAVSALITGDWSKAGRERELSQEVARQKRRETAGIFMPLVSLSRELTIAGSAGSMKETTLYPENFIELLRKKMFLQQLGASIFPDCVGDVAIPRQSASATAYWVAEGSDVTLSDQTFDQLTGAPKTVGGITKYSRKTILQTQPAVEQLVRNDLALTVSVELDRAGINGSGSGAEPLGILGTSGIGSVVGGTNGLAPTWDHIVDLEKEVAVDNADVGALGYLTNAKVRAKLKKTPKISGQPIYVWPDTREESGFGTLNGYRAGSTNQVPDNLTKGTSSGVCSAIIFGDWSQLIIFHWGVLEILADPFTYFKSGAVQIRALMDVDLGVRHVESFAAMKDALTT